MKNKIWEQSSVLQRDLEQIAASDQIDWELLAGKSVFITGATGLLGSLLARGIISASQARNLKVKVLAFVRNEEKAKILYDFLDESKLFKGTVRKEDRSLMNVPFVTGDKDLDAKFVEEAKKAGFENLKGHRSVGGMRASIYNAMPKEGVEKLVEFMKKFEEENA